VPQLRQLLGVPADTNVIFERYSDSAACYIRLDSENIAVYKQLYRAAKAKLKLRIKAIVVNLPRSLPEAPEPPVRNQSTELQNPPRYSYLDTVLSSPLPGTNADDLPSAPSSVPNLTAEFSNGSAFNQPAEYSNAEVSSISPRYREFVLSQDSLHLPVASHTSPAGAFCIDCNHCGRSIANEHYHCSTCENGDYDLCPQCVDAGVSCPGANHWLIKRFVKDGFVTNSVTETVPPRNRTAIKAEEETNHVESVPDQAPEKISESPSVTPESPAKTDERICNACLKDFDETKMVSCADCEDYDLCMTCLLKDAHGHHPGHTFTLIHDRNFCLKSLVLSRCSPGRHHQHAAICDGCNKRIIGVRHKCLACPDWDYCSSCVSTAPQNHTGHRFVPIYEAIAEPPHGHEVHYGIFCDGPLCENKPSAGYIAGVRYKCAVCHDTDFCADCEALPTNTHNRTHPLIKFKTPVRSVTVNTIGDDGGHMISMGDRVRRSVSTQADATAVSNNIANEKVHEKHVEEKVEPPIAEKTDSVSAMEQPKVDEWRAPLTEASQLQAFFIRDTITDGTQMPPNTVFQQTWTLYNPGPLAWPAGSDVRFVGGDSMFNVDTNHPSSLDSIKSAMESHKLSKPVESGQSADFTVTLKTPSREGTAISYWRLKLANGVPFGHRLWCDVQVRAESSETPKSEPIEIKQEKAETDSDEAHEHEESESVGSTMIFPTLDKESPETSTHESMGTVVPPAPSLSTASERDILEDVESLTLEDNDTDDGFMTDEEYDVLDASDQEFLEAKQLQQ
jgi:next-to-BRCA1 protein 1